MGYIRQQPEQEIYLYTAEHLEEQIAVMLGGSISEKLLLGNGSTGSANDFSKAVDLAKKIISSGLSSLGVVSINDLPGGLLHKTIQEIISRQEKWVAALLSKKKHLIEEIADYLLEKEKISGDMLREMISSHRKIG